MKLFVVLSWMLKDVERTTIGRYGVSRVDMAWYTVSNYVEHASCHVTINAFFQRNSEHNQHLTTCRMRGIPIVNVQGSLVRVSSLRMLRTKSKYFNRFCALSTMVQAPSR